jgi:hypothetical protein
MCSDIYIVYMGGMLFECRLDKVLLMPEYDNRPAGKQCSRYHILHMNTDGQIVPVSFLYKRMNHVPGLKILFIIFSDTSQNSTRQSISISTFELNSSDSSR